MVGLPFPQPLTYHLTIALRAFKGRPVSLPEWRQEGMEASGGKLRVLPRKGMMSRTSLGLLQSLPRNSYLVWNGGGAPGDLKEGAAQGLQQELL